MVACDKKNKRNPAAVVDEVRKDRDLQKTFQSECKPIGTLARIGQAPSAPPQLALTTEPGTLNAEGIKSTRVIYKFLGNRISHTTISYAQDNCAQEVWRFEETGRFKNDENKK